MSKRIPWEYSDRAFAQGGVGRPARRPPTAGIVHGMCTVMHGKGGKGREW